jgi:hypothetical protein
MSEDIVERLRSWRHDSWPADPSLEAAAEIERLRARVAQLEARLSVSVVPHAPGCACPPGSNISCTSAMCPRKTLTWTS